MPQNLTIKLKKTHLMPDHILETYCISSSYTSDKPNTLLWKHSETKPVDDTKDNIFHIFSAYF